MNRFHGKILDGVIYPFESVVDPENFDMRRRMDFYRHSVLPFPNDLQAVHDRLWAQTQGVRVASDAW